MMNKKIICYLTIAFFFVGCIASINPIYTEKELIFNDGLLGTWRDSAASEHWDFEKVGEKGYKLSHTDQLGKATFKAFLVQLGDYLFLDLYPEKTPNSNSLQSTHNLPLHTFSKINITSDYVTLQMLDAEWFEQGVKNNQFNLSYLKSPEGRVILTASTQDLQSFIMAHSNSEEAFGKKLVLSRK